MRGLSEENGSWKMICISRRNGFISRLLKPRDVLPADADRAVGRLDQPQDGAADGGFAAAGLADQAERLALADREADAIDRQHVLGRAPKKPFLIGKCFFSPSTTSTGARSAGGAAR